MMRPLGICLIAAVLAGAAVQRSGCEGNVTGECVSKSGTEIESSAVDGQPAAADIPSESGDTSRLAHR